MLTSKQFKVLYALYRLGPVPQRDIVREADLSLGAVNATLKELRAVGLLDDAGVPTPAGKAALEPYKVENAVIMAAGLSSRFAPISYERPKGLLKVRGEVLVERQIRQLREAGISDITVVVGYMKEQFFYLEDEMGVGIVVNPDYASRNNNSTIRRVASRLGNTYICSSDDYFAENPFESHVYEPYYAAVWEDGPTDEYCLQVRGKQERIVGVDVGGADAWAMMGHAYWDRAFSREFLAVLDEVYDRPETAGKLWEDIYREHIERLPMVMRRYPHGVIWEFDSLDELRAFDPGFITNIDSQIIDNICATLGCERAQIGGIEPIKQGLTNLSFRFSVDAGPGEAAGAADAKTYVYRHPGAGTDEIIDRASEASSQQVARELGLDPTFVHEDERQGWKVSRYLEGCRGLDYGNWNEVARALAMARTLHDSGADTGHPYDLHQVTLKMVDLLGARQRTSYHDFEALLERIDHLNGLAAAHGARTCLCHNDFYKPNFLVGEDGAMALIDWEYSGMSDYAGDLGTFICCAEEYGYDEACRVIRLYFGRDPSPEELFHCIAYTSVVSFYWFVWALYKDECGDPVGEWLYLWYKFAKLYAAKAEELAKGARGDDRSLTWRCHTPGRL